MNYYLIEHPGLYMYGYSRVIHTNPEDAILLCRTKLKAIDEMKELSLLDDLTLYHVIDTVSTSILEDTGWKLISKGDY